MEGLRLLISVTERVSYYMDRVAPAIIGNRQTKKMIFLSILLQIEAYSLGSCALWRRA